MDKSVQGAIAVEPSGAAWVRMYPGTNLMVHVERETALHLFSLIIRYNKYLGKTGWKNFWPKITQIERSFLTLFLSVNSPQQRQQFFNKFALELTVPQQAAADYRKVFESKRHTKASAAVLNDFKDLYLVHVKASLPSQEVLRIWQEQWPEVVALLKNHGRLDNLLADGRCYSEELVFDAVHELLLAHGHGILQSNEDHEFYCRNDGHLFAGEIFRHVPTDFRVN